MLGAWGLQATCRAAARHGGSDEDVAVAVARTLLALSQGGQTERVVATGGLRALLALLAQRPDSRELRTAAFALLREAAVDHAHVLVRVESSLREAGQLDPRLLRGGCRAGALVDEATRSLEVPHLSTFPPLEHP